MSYQRAAALDALWPGEMVGVQVGNMKVVLINHEGTVHAFEDRCAHQAALLSKGRLDGKVLTCSVHHWCYDVSNGEGINPRNSHLRRLPTKIEDEQIFVDVEE